MRLVLHMTAPIGEATRREVEHALNLLRIDNMYWISARLNSGLPVPPTAHAAGVEYLEPTAAEAKTSTQEFFGAPFLFRERKHGSGKTCLHGACGDLAAYDAAALTVMSNVPTRIIVPAQGPTRYHALVITPYGPYDPTRRNEEWPSL
jgi:hypothetical protein